KPARADGIAVTGGRVGRCLFLHGSPCWKQSRASFVYVLPYFHVQAIAYPPHCWLSQHMAVGEPGPSAAVPQPPLPCSCHCPTVVWCITISPLTQMLPYL
ncbi:MAG: hypothetical protein LBV59_17305, partial [Sphingobacterium sp.]|uniref:hypothetical protein n=1 Tax=Sphingobacterium sp. TaxID=341027 RepID=UPI0028411581